MKKDTKLILIVLAGILAIVLLCIFAVQGTQNNAFTLEEQVNTAQSDIRVQEKRRVDLVYNLADCVMQDITSPHKVWMMPLDILRCTIEMLNAYRESYLETKDKQDWWQMIQLLPSSYNQRRTVMLNYEVLANMYKSRRNHKLDEWHTFCDWIESLPYSELITGKGNSAPENSYCSGRR